MSLINERQDFSTIADTFLLHGSMQSPAFLDGRLCASLALHDLDAEGWLEMVCLNLGVEQPETSRLPSVSWAGVARRWRPCPQRR